MNRILIYDRDSHEAVQLSRFLQASGYAVATVATARQAVSFAREYDFELLIINLANPGETDYTTVAEIKCRPQSARVGVIGLFSDPGGMVAAERTGCDAVLCRPFDPEQLLQKIQEIIENSNNAITHIESMDANPPSTQPTFAALADSLYQGVQWLETRVGDLGEQGPVAIESMRDAATSLRQRLEPEKISPGSNLPDSVRDRHMRHDFRNLLAAVNGFAEILLLDADALPEDLQTQVRKLKTESREFCTLLDGIRDTVAA